MVYSFDVVLHVTQAYVKLVWGIFLKYIPAQLKIVERHIYQMQMCRIKQKHCILLQYCKLIWNTYNIISRVDKILLKNYIMFKPITVESRKS